ncbi:hypothetical protein AMECASPLE_036339 [Ameca splendens]|uniref:Uncharacterized protein n=1 Tax=Ameca splendens TaxID=208324 RepID=A0ABV0Z688_9TELE
MWKTAQKRTSDHNKLAESGVPTADDHDNVGADLQTEADREDFPPLPITPSKPVRCVERNEKVTTTCSNRVTELERYGRCWNLRLQGVPETDKEDVLEDVIRVCQEVLPRERERLQFFIDVAHGWQLPSSCYHPLLHRQKVSRLHMEKQLKVMIF